MGLVDETTKLALHHENNSCPDNCGSNLSVVVKLLNLTITCDAAAEAAGEEAAAEAAALATADVAAVAEAAQQQN